MKKKILQIIKNIATYRLIGLGAEGVKLDRICPVDNRPSTKYIQTLKRYIFLT